MYTCVYSERENEIVLVSPSEGATGGEKDKENVRNWKNSFKYKYNLMYCTVSCRILGKHDDTQWESNGRKGVNLTKAC
jgi:hypothetical protein